MMKGFVQGRIVAFLAACLMVWSVGCTDQTADDEISPHQGECTTAEDCEEGQECIDGTCQSDPDDPPPDAGVDANTGEQDTGDADAGPDPDPDVDCPDPNTCEDEGVECGWIADGCGGSVFCGECPEGLVCGTGDGGDDEGQCIAAETVCTPDASCEEEGVECGAIPDGCGGAVDCGGCPDGEVCGFGEDAGQCIPEECEPLSCDDYDPGECGVVPDGCGDFIDCGGCAADEQCDMDAGGECEPIACDPLDCEDHGAECGPMPDGCGGEVFCGTCSGDNICGTGDDLGECVEPSCDPLDCDDYPDANCGVMSDGCGGTTGDCGSCTDPEICGGGGQPNVCGAQPPGEDGGCVNLCQDQAVCADGEATTLTGTVYAPNGDLPIPNASVYVPNDPIDELPEIEDGPVCEQCEDEDLGSPLVGTNSDYDGTFELRHVPADVEFPLVIKVGQWRRVVTIDPQDPCETTELDAEDTRLPTSQEEESEHDNIPKTAITTGAVDAMECVFEKLGVDHSEFTRNYEDGRIHIYRANGGVADDDLGDACQDVVSDPCAPWGWSCPTYRCATHDCTDRDPASCQDDANGIMMQDNLSHNLYTDSDRLHDYDMVVMGCEATDNSSYRDDDDLDRIRDYVDSGGRLFASHYAYDWLHNTEDLEDTAVWQGNASYNNYGLAFVDDTFTAGATFWDWLQLVDADYDDTGPGGEPQIEIHDPRTYVEDVNDSLSTRWVYTDGDAPGHNNIDSIQQYTFETPVYEDDDQQCGQVAYSAFHVDNVSTGSGPAFPTYCDGDELSPQEKVLAYMLFELASCVTDEGEPPEPECEPMDCDDQGVECGQVSDGCGEVIDCGGCPDGQACGAGDEPNVCSGDCEPLDCDDHGADCGTVDDGCGGTIDCGECPDGESCGAAGTPNQCGCEPLDCDDHNAECGQVSDGCGGTLDCGDCPDGQACGGDGSANVCTSDCEPFTCADHGAECGTVADGCGETLDCGDCPDPDTCGGGGEPNICDCQPLSCDDHDAECGEVSDGCGETLDCGECPEGGCEDNQCVCLAPGEPCQQDADCCTDSCAISASEEVGECVTQ